MPTNEEIKEAQRMVYIVQSSEYLSEVDKALLVFAAAYRELLSRAESAEEQLRLANVDALTETARANDAETRAAETKTQAAKIWDRRVEPASSAEPEALREALINVLACFDASASLAGPEQFAPDIPAAYEIARKWPEVIAQARAALGKE